MTGIPAGSQPATPDVAPADPDAGMPTLKKASMPKIPQIGGDDDDGPSPTKSSSPVKAEAQASQTQEASPGGKADGAAAGPPAEDSKPEAAAAGPAAPDSRAGEGEGAAAAAPAPPASVLKSVLGGLWGSSSSS